MCGKTCMDEREKLAHDSDCGENERKIDKTEPKLKLI